MLLLVILAVLLSGCTGQTPETPAPSPSPTAAAVGADIAGTAWVLTAYADGGGSLSPVINGTVITASFGEDGQISGSAGCNRYGGSFVAEGDSITFGPLVTTLRACSDPAGVMEQETAFLTALESAASYRVADSRLEIAAATGAVVLQFAPAPTPAPLPLAGTTWQLASYLTGEGAVVPVIPGTGVTATFGGDGRVTGSAGCNDYFAPYEVNGTGISVGPAGSTRMYCSSPAGVMDQERAYLAALVNASSFSVNADTLRLRDAGERTVLTFTAGPPSAIALAGTSWTLLQLKGAADGMVDVRAGTTVTVEFREGNILGGSAGCNSYTASYAIEDSRISVGPIAVTEIYCTGPAGVMEQESTYLALLRSVRTVAVEDGMLILSDGGGIPILLYSPS
jgi:heat shock protein HslJ